MITLIDTTILLLTYNSLDIRSRRRNAQDLGNILVQETLVDDAYVAKVKFLTFFVGTHFGWIFNLYTLV